MNKSMIIKCGFSKVTSKKKLSMMFSLGKSWDAFNKQKLVALEDKVLKSLNMCKRAKGT